MKRPKRKLGRKAQAAARRRTERKIKKTWREVGYGP